ncbi:MAG: hypothetical protein GQ574_14870 [Crocinitomix sp.]|nr:hypothetical protein [Crocinitomix sp.]
MNKLLLKKTAFPFIFSIVLLAFAAACKKTDPEISEDPADEDIECSYMDGFVSLDSSGLTEMGLIPLNINNYWVYADSSWDTLNNLISSGIDTMRPVSTRITGDDIWWTFDTSPATYFAEIHQKNDSIYVLTPPDFGIGCHSKSLRYYDIASDTLYDGVFEFGYGRMRKTHWVTGITATPAGDFTNCYSFSLHDESGDYYELLKPSIGFVKYKRNHFDLGRQERTLIDYYIE